MPDGGRYTSLWDWRRQVGAMYAKLQGASDASGAWLGWRQARDSLFRSHPQSPLEGATREKFESLPFFPYDTGLRFAVEICAIEGPAFLSPAGADGDVRLSPFACTRGLQSELGRELTLFWIEAYGGGVFLPFADATNGEDTYGGGRYLLDTIKGADLGIDGIGRTVLDFNFAYNPSCSYSDRYICPLAPPDNRLPVAVRGGERR
jgi:uncharacterized protein (DUF1684 family)